MSNMRDPRVGKMAQKFNNFVEKDPVRVNSVAKGKASDPDRKNVIYALLCAIPILLIVSMIFFLIAHVEGSMMGTPE